MHAPHSNPPPAQPPPPPPPSMAPPTRPGAMPGKRSTWPTVVGVVSIVLSALGIVGGIIGLIFAGMNAAMVQSGWWTMAAHVLNFATSGLLLVVGVGLVNRRRWSVGLGQVWAGIDIATVLVSTAFGFLVQGEQMSGAGVSSAWYATIFLLGLAWGLFWPVFLLIWLRRQEIRKETAGWR